MEKFDLEKILNSEVINVTKDALEVALDSVMDDSILKDIPVLGSLVGMVKIGLNIRDKAFVKTLCSFLYQLNETSYEQRHKVITKINENNDFQSRLGEKLVFILEKASDTEKATYIGSLFRHVLYNELGYNMFIRCAETINNVFILDLKWFLSKRHMSFNYCTQSDSLMYGGILVKVNANPLELVNNGRNLTYKMTDVGNCLHKYLGNQDTKLESINETPNDKDKW